MDSSDLCELLWVPFRHYIAIKTSDPGGQSGGPVLVPCHSDTRVYITSALDTNTSKGVFIRRLLSTLYFTLPKLRPPHDESKDT